MKKTDQTGFSIIEALLILVVVGILGFTSWYVYHAKQVSGKNYSAVNNSTTPTYNKRTATKATTSTTANQYAGWHTFTTVDKAYTVSYPADWIDSTGSCVNDGDCHTDAFSFDNIYSPSSNPTWQVITTLHDNSSLSPEAWLMQSGVGSITSVTTNDCFYAADSSSVNGYQAYFVEDFMPLDSSSSSCPTSPPAGVYSYGKASGVGYMDYYVVSHDNQVALFSMPVQDGSNGTRNTVPLVSTFKEIAQSIKFDK